MRILLFLLIATSAWGQKDTTYWNHIYHPKRLIFVKADTTLTGVVLKEISEGDGDYHVLIMTADSTKIDVEIICVFKQKNRICSGYNNTIPVPRKGMRVEVFGDYVFDNKHKWPEIHPVKKIKIL